MKNIISKLLMGTISENELIELRNWLNDPRNQSILESYVGDYHDLNLTLLKNNVDVAYNKVVNQIDRNERPIKKLFPNWAKYAAAVVLLFGVGFFYQHEFFTPKDESIIISKNESIILELDNGDIQTIDVSKIKEVRDTDGNVIGTQKQNRISYNQKDHNVALAFNTLRVPYGKQFQLELSDGTVVHLNAGSSLRYPMNFLSEGPRQVFLSGEGYFDVTENKINPFIVNVNELDVKVLGTEFNISAYTEDSNVDVVLVKGSVSLNSHGGLLDGLTNLVPGQKGSFGNISNKISITQVYTEIYTSWMIGYLVFKEQTFDHILTKLERHYNIEIENRNKVLGNEIFNASFNNVDIEKVLSFFNDTHEIDYIIENNKIIIK